MVSYLPSSLERTAKSISRTNSISGSKTHIQCHNRCLQSSGDPVLIKWNRVAQRARSIPSTTSHDRYSIHQYETVFPEKVAKHKATREQVIRKKRSPTMFGATDLRLSHPTSHASHTASRVLPLDITPSIMDAACSSSTDLNKLP